MSAPDKYTSMTKDEFNALKSIYESVFGDSKKVSEQIMFRGTGDIESPQRDIAPDKPVKIMDEQDVGLDDETVDAIENDIENQIDNDEPEFDQGMADAADMGTGSNAAIAADLNDGDDNESTAESVIKMTVQMAIFKGIRDVADEFSKSFDIDKFALLARFQKYLLNPENLENASTSVVQLIKTKKQQQQKKDRQELIQQSRRDNN